MKKWKMRQKGLVLALVVALLTGSGAVGWGIGDNDVGLPIEQAYDAGWEDGSAYSSNSSWSEGYEAGYDLGYEEGSDDVICPDNYQTGYVAGYTAGHDAGYDAGQDACPTCPSNNDGGNGAVDNWPGKKTEKPGNPSPGSKGNQNGR